MGMKKQWVFVGKEATITKPEYEDLQRRVASFAQRYCPKQAPSLDTKARGRFFYIGQKIRGVVLPLCRLEKCDDNQWMLGFAAGFSNRYQPCLFPHTGWYGTVEGAMEVILPFLDV